MPLDLAVLKERLGIDPADTAQDVTITAIAEQAQALCELYCDRKFDLMADKETFLSRGAIFLVRRWPIAPDPPPVITAPDLTPVFSEQWCIDYEKGMIAHPDYWWGGATIAYTGGFEPWPPALAWAVTTAFDVLWAESPGGALPPGPPASAGNVRRYSVVGAFSVEATSGGVGEIGANEGTGWGPFPASVTRALDSYRRESRIGAG
jgi:hypothetical protein